MIKRHISTHTKNKIAAGLFSALTVGLLIWWLMPILSEAWHAY